MIGLHRTPWGFVKDTKQCGRDELINEWEYTSNEVIEVHIVIKNMISMHLLG